MAAPARNTTPLPSYVNVVKSPQTSAARYELRISSIYLHHKFNPNPNPSHQTLLQPNGPNKFGETVANDWAVYDGPDPGVNAVVARAQGLHLLTGNWSAVFNIVFEKDGLKGSTLQVMGSGVHEGDQWGILSGTGLFSMAQGLINKKLIPSKVNDGNIIELDIYAVVQPTKINLITEGPKGGSGGQYHEPTAVPHRLKQINIRDSAVIDSIQYTYVDEFGLEYTEGPWGGYSSFDTPIILEDDEFVKEVSGTIGRHNGSDVVTSLKFVTNRRTKGPFGTVSGDHFTLPEKPGGSIVGFIARTGECVNAIGVIMRK